MTKFESIASDRDALQKVQRMPLGIGTAVCFGAVIALSMSSRYAPFIWLVSLWLLPKLVHHLLFLLSSSYEARAKKIALFSAGIAELKRRSDEFYQEIPKREKWAQFKVAYALTGRTVQELERTLAIGMHHEGKEVFVTAFIREGVVLRATATVGSSRSCSNSDNMNSWPEHIERLECDEIRQYHNHPVYTGKTQPSPQDCKTSKHIETRLGKHKTKLSSYIIYWNALPEWKLLKYDNNGLLNIEHEQDVSSYTKD